MNNKINDGQIGWEQSENSKKLYDGQNEVIKVNISFERYFEIFFFRRRLKNLNPMHFVETGFVIKRRFWSTRTITLVWNERKCVWVCKKVCVTVCSSVCLRERKRVSLRIKEKGRGDGRKAVCMCLFVCVCLWVCVCVCAESVWATASER